MSTVFILLDAFRHDYLDEETTPFLCKCAQTGEHYAAVEQSLGFCERTEVLTGLRGDESGFFTAIGYDPQNSPYADVPILPALNLVELVLLRFLRILPKRFASRVHKKLRGYTVRYFQRRGITMPPYFIPFSKLPYFALTEDRVDHRKLEAFPVPSILTLLDEANRTYYYDTFTALGLKTKYYTDTARLDEVIRDASESAKDLYLVYVSAPDAYGHIHGPLSKELKKVLNELDNELKYFVERLEQATSGNRYLFLGDHGMLKVTKKINFKKEIDRLLNSSDLRVDEDVIYFLDSTMVRLWANSKKALRLLPNVLEGSEKFNQYGWWMTKELAEKFNVSWPDKRYGDYLWVANPGALVFPDFFHQLMPSKGMHGYDPKLPESQGMCIHWGAGIQPSKSPIIPLTGIFDILKRSLKL